MSIFAFGGSIGFALGPVVATALVTKFGIPGVGYLMVPTILLAGLFLFSLPAMGKITTRASAGGRKGAYGMHEGKEDDWKHFGVLTVLLVGRSIAFYGLNTFLALFWIDILGQSKTAASLALSVLFIVGATGTLAGGNLADRIGFKKIIQVSFLILPILLFALSVTRNATLALLLLLPIGVFLFLPNSPMVILGQRYLPNRMGLASGVTLGLAVSVGGIVAPFLGRLADNTSLAAAVQVLAVVIILPAIFSFFLVDK